MGKENLFTPIPTCLSRFEDRRSILYVCPKCGASFEMLGRMETKCHSCNVSIDWGDLPTKCSVDFRAKYEEVLYADEKKLKGKKREDVLKGLLFEYLGFAPPAVKRRKSSS